MLHRPLGTTGMRVSILGMGGSGFGGVYGKYDEKEAIKTVEVAIANGVNYFDTAYWYGQGKSEMFLGKALKGVPRDRFFVGTKVGRYERDIPNMFNFSAAKVTKSAEESLKRLQLDHVDILQIHDVEFAPSVDIIVNETLPALEKLKQRGLCKFIGITGYPLGPLREIIQRSTVKIDSVLTYCRLSLNDSSLTDSFDFFKSNGVPLINASPVSMGLLTHVPVQPWHPASEEVRQACARAVDYCDSQGVDITRIAVNYAVGFEEASTTLVSMNDLAILEKNIDAVTRPLTEEENEAKEYVLENFFRPLSQSHWEGVEVAQYWEAVRSNSTGKHNLG